MFSSMWILEWRGTRAAGIQVLGGSSFPKLDVPRQRQADTSPGGTTVGNSATAAAVGVGLHAFLKNFSLLCLRSSSSRADFPLYLLDFFWSVFWYARNDPHGEGPVVPGGSGRLRIPGGPGGAGVAGPPVRVRVRGTMPKAALPGHRRWGKAGISGFPGGSGAGRAGVPRGGGGGQGLYAGGGIRARRAVGGGSRWVEGAGGGSGGGGRRERRAPGGGSGARARRRPRNRERQRERHRQSSGTGTGTRRGRGAASRGQRERGRAEAGGGRSRAGAGREEPPWSGRGGSARRGRPGRGGSPGRPGRGCSHRWRGRERGPGPEQPRGGRGCSGLPQGWGSALRSPRVPSERLVPCSGCFILK